MNIDDIKRTIRKCIRETYTVIIEDEILVVKAPKGIDVGVLNLIRYSFEGIKDIRVN